MSSGEVSERDRDATRAVSAWKVRCAGVMSASVVVSLALAPEALARITLNHNETLLTSD